MRNWFRNFMLGRNGVDVLAIVSLVLGLIINAFCGRVLPSYLVLLAYAFVCYGVFRMLSRNVSKRREENYKFVSLYGRLQKRWRGWRERRSMAKDYKFFTCPGCKNKLRVPRGKGSIKITCPRCGQRFGGKT